MSVITPALNAAPFIAETIASVQRQSNEDWEMLIVDNGSTDGTAAVVERAAARDPRVRLLHSTPGIAPARNAGVANARGRFLAFIDSDDLWDPNKLELQLDFMRERDAPFSFTRYRLVTESGELLGHAGFGGERIGYRDMLRGRRVGTLTVMLDLHKVGRPEFPVFKKASDLAGWLSILQRGHVAHGLDAELATYRVVSTSVSRSKVRYTGRVWDVYRAQPVSTALLAIFYAEYFVTGLVRHLTSGAFRVRAASSPADRMASAQPSTRTDRAA